MADGNGNDQEIVVGNKLVIVDNDMVILGNKIVFVSNDIVFVGNWIANVKLCSVASQPIGQIMQNWKRQEEGMTF